MIQRTLLAAMLVSVAISPMAVAAPPFATARKPVKDVSELPRFSYSVTGDLGRFLDQPEQLRPFVMKLKADVSGVLRDYDIQDRATVGQLHEILRSVATYESDAAAFARENDSLRSHQDKPALKAWLGAVESARLAAAATARPGSSAYELAFRSELQSRLDALNWGVVGQTVKERYRGRATASVGVIRGYIADALQPSVDKGGSLDMNGLAELLRVVNLLQFEFPLIDSEREIERAWISRHDKPKADIWQARTVALPSTATLNPVVIGIWDSGTDADLFRSAAWINSKEQPNGRDDDGNGWIDDVHGVAIDEKGQRDIPLLKPVPGELAGSVEQLALVNAGLADIETGLESSEAKDTVTLLRKSSAEDAKRLLGGLRWYSDYAHGTHVAGIAAAGNPAARLLFARTSFDWRSPPMRPTEETARAFAKAHRDFVDYFRKSGARVVNMSWHVGLKEEYENKLIANGVPAEQAAAEGKRLFAIEREGLLEAISSAPEILFVCAAGNSNDNSDFSGTVPSSFDLPNVITVAAVDQAGEPTNFTTSGSAIDIAASGYQVESYVPGGRRVRWSGTSMASPQVANAAAKLFALSPGMTVAQVRDILLTTATQGSGRYKLLDTRAAVARVARSVVAQR